MINATYRKLNPNSRTEWQPYDKNANEEKKSICLIMQVKHFIDMPIVHTQIIGILE